MPTKKPAVRTVTSTTSRKYTLGPEHRERNGISLHEVARLERLERRRWQMFCAVWDSIGWEMRR